jgi:hypothetical protein
MRSPAIASAVWPGFPGQVRPFRTTIDARLAMLEIVGAEEQIDEPLTACYVWSTPKGEEGTRCPTTF